MPRIRTTSPTTEADGSEVKTQSRGKRVLYTFSLVLLLVILMVLHLDFSTFKKGKDDLMMNGYAVDRCSWDLARFH